MNTIITKTLDSLRSLLLDVQVFKLTPDIDEYNKKSNKQISVNCYVFQHYVDE